MIQVREDSVELGRCKFCGAERAVWAPSRYEADLAVTGACACSGAVRARKFEKAHEALSLLESELRNEQKVSGEIKEMRARLEELENATKIILRRA